MIVKDRLIKMFIEIHVEKVSLLYLCAIINEPNDRSFTSTIFTFTFTLTYPLHAKGQMLVRPIHSAAN